MIKLSPIKLKELLVDSDFINQDDFDLAVAKSKDKKQDLQDILVEENLIKNEQLGQLVAEELGFSFIDLSKERIDEEVLSLIPELVASHRQIIAFSKSDSGVKVGMTDPSDLETIHLVEKRIGEKILVYYITKKDLFRSLELYRGSVKNEFDKILESLRDPVLSREGRDQSVVQMVDTLLEYGQQNKASDIHIEPYRKNVVIRFRIDGVMHKVLELPKEFHELILARIKILSKMRIDEHRAAQDGKFRFVSDREVIDVRVSIVPIVEGENVVMRLLSAAGRKFTLEGIGLSSDNLKKIKKAIKNPHGMILVTGPTGSGKTTTLYAILNILNKPEVHISTIEDPVEYDVEGISQIQVNTKTNLTFAKGLRALVRQDPDIIMVGEIRDSETADIAVNSALTGHLVLSTLHTNDAPTTLPRLLDMKIEPFLVASTINIIIAQRLVRKICEKCRESKYIKASELQGQMSNELLQQISKGGDEIHCYHGRGCKACGNTGYIGRIGIFEVLEMTEEIKSLVVERASSNKISELARSQGMKTMMENGIGSALNGVTTIEEVLRVTKQ